MTTLNTQAIAINEGNVYITLVEEGYAFMPAKDQVMPITDEDGTVGELHYGIADTGVASFGIWYEEKSQRPGHGKLWSSRAGVVSPLIGVPLVAVGINRMATHITVPAMEALLIAQGLDTSYCVVERNSYGEVVYEVVSK